MKQYIALLILLFLACGEAHATSPAVLGYCSTQISPFTYGDPTSGICSVTPGETDVYSGGTKVVAITSAGVNLGSGDAYSINGASALSATTLGSGVTASSLTSLGNLSSLTMGGNITISAHNIVTDTTTGTDIATATNQKLGFYGATPVVQQGGDILTALGAYGFGTLTIAAGDVPTLNQNTTGTAASVTGATQSAITSAPNLATVGTIGTGVWQGTAVAAGFGGTGISTSSSTGVAQVSSGVWSVSNNLAVGTVLTLGTSASATNPQRSGDGTTGIFSGSAGTISISGGGTDAADFTSGGVNIVNGTLSVNGYLGLAFSSLDSTAGGTMASGVGALTGLSTGSINYRDTAFGYHALSGTMTSAAVRNTAFGYSAFAAVTIGNHNTGLGVSAGLANTTGSNNTAVGEEALSQNVTGSGNTIVGQGALVGVASNSTSDNTALGYETLGVATTGASNVAIGYQVASTVLTTGSSNILIGTSAAVTTASASTSSNLNIGNLLQGDMTNSTALGKEALYLQSTASSVDYVQIAGGATGGANPGIAAISAAGTDTNVNLALNPKGAGAVTIGPGLTTLPTSFNAAYSFVFSGTDNSFIGAITNSAQSAILSFFIFALDPQAGAQVGTNGATNLGFYTQSQATELTLNTNGGAAFGLSSTYDQATPTANHVIVQAGVEIGTTAPNGSSILTVVQSTSGVAASFKNSTGTCTHTPGSSSETVSCSSDANLKTNIKDTDLKALDWVSNFRLRQFDMKLDGKHQDAGVVAQEVQAVRPEMVHSNSVPSIVCDRKPHYNKKHQLITAPMVEAALPCTDAPASSYLSVDQPDPWKLVKAIQELKAINDNQQKEIDDLRKRAGAK